MSSACRSPYYHCYLFIAPPALSTRWSDHTLYGFLIKDSAVISLEAGTQSLIPNNGNKTSPVLFLTRIFHNPGKMRFRITITKVDLRHKPGTFVTKGTKYVIC